MGILLALISIGFPFVVRTLQPILLTLSDEVEEAAATPGIVLATIFVTFAFAASGCGVAWPGPSVSPFPPARGGCGLSRGVRSDNA